MDGDFQHDPKYIIKLVKIFLRYNHDVVVGARNLASIKKTKLSIFRLGSSIIITNFMNIILGKKTSDPLSGFFLFKKSIYIQNKNNLFSSGYKILADLIYSSKQDLYIKDISIKFGHRLKGESKINIKILFILLFFIFQKLKNKIF